MVHTREDRIPILGLHGSCNRRPDAVVRIFQHRNELSQRPLIARRLQCLDCRGPQTRVKVGQIGGDVQRGIRASGCGQSLQECTHDESVGFLGQEIRQQRRYPCIQVQDQGTDDLDSNHRITVRYKNLEPLQLIRAGGREKWFHGGELFPGRLQDPPRFEADRHARVGGGHAPHRPQNGQRRKHLQALQAGQA